MDGASGQILRATSCTNGRRVSITPFRRWKSLSPKTPSLGRRWASSQAASAAAKPGLAGGQAVRISRATSGT
jgi:hypothetical protein